MMNITADLAFLVKCPRLKVAGNRKPRQIMVLSLLAEVSTGSLMYNPNAIAYAALALWVVVAWQFWRHFTPQKALVWTILGGYLLLPEKTAFNLPAVPDLNKDTLPNLVALFASYFMLRHRSDWFPRTILMRALVGIYVFAPFMTVLTNQEPVFWGDFMIPGMRLYDSLAVMSYQIITLVPYFLARRYLSGEHGALVIFKSIVLGGVIYALPMLIEVRLSPQLHLMIYGFFQHDFFQTMRYGGFRPVVFLEHGLWVAIYVTYCVAATTVFLREATAERRPKILALLGLFLILTAACKSVGPAIMSTFAFLLLLLAGRRMQVGVAALFALIVITYPALRGLHIFPIDALQDFLKIFGEDRTQSLSFRITNEETLLAWAQQKPWFGWGGYARNLIHDVYTGQIMTIGDGAWIITMGITGWAGYIGEFGLVTLPIVFLCREVFSTDPAKVSPYVTGLAVLHAVNLVDLLPNATIVPLTWLVAGAILGEAERLRRLREDTKTVKKFAKTQISRTVI